MDFEHFTNHLRQGKTPVFPAEAKEVQFAKNLDGQDELAGFRDQFIIPTRASLQRKSLNAPPTCNGTNGTQPNGTRTNESPSIYFVGNSLGAQPKAVREYLNVQLNTWASIGVNGHFTAFDDSPLVGWQDMAEDCARKSVDIVGAKSTGEIAIMNTLTANLHLMLASFYRPTEQRHKIIIEWRPFPSDWYATQTQIEWHSFSPSTSLIEIQPSDPDTLYVSTERILSVIDEHADSTALLLLPGIQYYTGQLFDIPTITKYAHDRGIVVGWDLAHAAGNVELKLHDWDVDFAVWCNYKYLNAGPGAIAGAFVHENHHGTDPDGKGSRGHRFRLGGWYGQDKSVRFNMDKTFKPTKGAPGFQLSNPSAIDLASLSAALEVFGQAGPERLRKKAGVLTAYLEWLLERVLEEGDGEPAFKILTPKNPKERGTQLSLLLREGLLERVSKTLADNGVVCDARKPNVIRVAPVPLYCTFEDVWRFVDIFKSAVI